MKVAVYRKAHFNAAHRLHNPLFSDAENQKVFGKCNNANFHGHNYELIVKIVGPIQESTGYVIDMKILKEIIETHIEEKFDHKNLNLDIPEFANLNPTVENLAVVIWNILRSHIDPELELFVILFETERNYVEYPIY